MELKFEVKASETRRPDPHRSSTKSLSCSPEKFDKSQQASNRCSCEFDMTLRVCENGLKVGSPLAGLFFIWLMEIKKSKKRESAATLRFEEAGLRASG